MRKNILFILSILLVSFIGMASCSDDDNNGYDEEWKKYNDSIYYSLGDKPEYSKANSLSENGFIYIKKFTSENSPFETKFTEITDESPLFTDSVVCRYMGWYFAKDGTPIIFDGTENEIVINGETYTKNFNKKQGTSFRVNGVIDGWATALQGMKAGDECQICIPFLLGYGVNGLTSSGVQIIPGYTTLWFNMKLLKVIRND